jgi:cytochrome c biogenesis protein CcdA
MFDQFTELINQSSPFLFGVASAFTPCTIAIFPLLLYRFGFGKNRSEQKKNFLGLLIVAVTFVLTFAITGLVLQYLILSEIANVFRLILGALLVMAGVLQLTGRLNLITFQRFSHPVLIGVTLPWMLSFSPCVLAFTANLVVSSAGSASIDGNSALQFSLFALGILFPPFALALAGNAATGLTRKFSHALGWIEKIAPLALIIAGVFLINQIVQITSSEVLWAALLLVAGFSVFWWKRFSRLSLPLGSTFCTWIRFNYPV